VLLCPAGPFTAVRPDEWRVDMYTVWVNVMDVSCSSKLVLRGY